MENATIVTLGPSGEGVVTASFEEAFGEFSELRGRGRARRHKRRSERQQNRIARRRARKKGRQEIRAEQQDARFTRRRKRRALRDERKEGGAEGEMDETTQTEMGDGASQDNSQGGGDYTEQPLGIATREDEDGAETQGDDSQDGDVYANDNQGSGAAEGTGEDSEEDSDSFDGVMGAEDRFNELTDGKVKISPIVADLTKKVEWNKELISKLNIQKAGLQGRNTDSSDVSKQIAERKARIGELEAKLSEYSNCQGEYSMASGKPPMALLKRRQEEVLRGRNFARRYRKGHHNTPVSKGLHPQFGSNRIVVPAQMKSNATGLNGLDLVDDFDAPDARFIELQSNAAGEDKKKINWTGIVIGGVVAVGVIWAIKKYKVLGK